MCIHTCVYIYIYIYIMADARGMYMYMNYSQHFLHNLTDMVSLVETILNYTRDPKSTTKSP